MTKHHQASLFDDTPAKAISIVSALGRDKPTDKQQATFQRLLRQVDEQRTRLADWNTYHTRYEQRLSGELLPLYADYRAVRCRMVALLDSHWDKRTLKGKRQQIQLKTLLVDLLEILLDEQDDSTLAALYQKHCEISFAEQKAEELIEQRQVLEDFFGIPLNDLQDNGDIEDMIRQIHQKLNYPMDDDALAGHVDGAPPPGRRKSAKQQAAELKKEADTKTISQTVRAVYRKLASALHPDRETDAATREKKTEQMQRVNQAYEAGDLLSLLNLQFEIEQIDTDHLTSLPPERLGHYNQVLREQLAELKGEIEAATALFRQLCPWQTKLAPHHVDRAMNEEILKNQQEIAQITEDLETLQDPAELKLFIQAFKTY